MYGERDEFFFHFTTAEAAFEFILPDRLLRLSPHSLLRDPLEYKDWEFGTFSGAYYPGNLGDEAAMKALAEHHCVERGQEAHEGPRIDGRPSGV